MKGWPPQSTRAGRPLGRGPAFGRGPKGPDPMANARTVKGNSPGTSRAATDEEKFPMREKLPVKGD